MTTTIDDIFTTRMPSTRAISSCACARQPIIQGSEVLGNLRTDLGLLEDADDLFFGETRLLHAELLGWNSTSNWLELTRTLHSEEEG